MKTLEILILIATILFVFVLFIKRYVYFRPSRQLQNNMFGFQDVFEGNLHAWFKPGSDKKVILFCHGNIGNLSNSTRQTKLNNLNEMGYNVLIFDYNGYGKSKGIPSETICFYNANIFMTFLFEKGFSRDNIVPYGENIGAYIATQIAVRYNLPFLILESPFINIKTYLSSYSSLLKPFGFIFNEFDTKKQIMSYKGKILLIHSIHDNTVLFKDISSFVSNSSLNIKLIETTGSHCSFDLIGQKKDIIDFFKK